MSIFNDIFWRESWWLLLAFMPALPVVLNSIFRRTKNSFSDAHLLPWVIDRQSRTIMKTLFSKNSAYIISWILIGIAVAGPRIPSDISLYKPTVDIDTMLVVDVSRSMHATDIKPSRLRRAQIEIDEFLNRAAGTRVGIVVFAARPHLFVPLTFDHEAIRHYLRSLDDLILPTHGSDPLSAVEMAYEELKGGTTPSAIIMISDGDFSEVNTLDSPPFYKSSATPIYALGIGSPEGQAIQIDKGKWLKHEGRSVITRLNEKDLRSFVAGKGDTDRGANERYITSTKDESDWIKLYDHGLLKSFNITEKIDNDNVIWNELFFWPLFPALILLWLSITPFGFINRYFFQRKKDKKTLRSLSFLTLSVLVVCSGIFFPKTASARSIGISDISNEISISRAYEKYTNGDFISSIKIYMSMTGYESRLGEGSCYYKLSKFNKAIRQFSLAVLLARNEQKRATALFNLGNAYFMMGDYEIAISIYNDSLLYNPSQKNVQHNINFSEVLMKSVKQRLNQFRQTSRMGSGPQQASSRDITNINEAGSLAIDQNTNREISEYPLPDLDDITTSELEGLIQKGLKRIRLAAINSDSLTHQNLIRKNISIINARLMMEGIEDQQTELWKRLFEMEEGFPAPLTAPKNVPGVAPW